VLQGAHCKQTTSFGLCGLESICIRTSRLCSNNLSRSVSGFIITQGKSTILRCIYYILKYIQIQNVTLNCYILHFPILIFLHKSIYHVISTLQNNLSKKKVSWDDISRHQTSRESILDSQSDSWTLLRAFCLR